MSSSVCQGLPSCPEPPLVESLVLRHKLTPPKSNFSQSHNNCSGDSEHKSNNNDDELGDWSCIQALSNASHKETVYVHPLVKRSSSILSMKSLEMCTESLGSETGSDISDEFSSLLSENQNFHTMHHRSKPRQFTKKVIGNDSFPPPLSSISGSDTVRVRPHREGGRLVIEAVSVSRNTYLQANRVNGRLRLCLLKDCSSYCQSTETKDEEKVTKCYEELERDENGDQEQNVDDDDYDHHDDSGGDCSSEGNGGNVGCEIGIEEVPRPSRCKEGGSGNKEMSSWGSFYVAIS
ncbi:protein FANTASTIC FOUR 3-like [Cornus florida]|uniref:protein FANTASTIC FOUR 3-like n=1 Tax=Cornus florida TaxID=4283 RepID=UPI00289B6544|nr:protein FANTASTIC FOUR 3-like [Cornus florida]